MYDQLMVKLSKEHQQAFKNFLGMPSEMYDELLQRVTVEIGATHSHGFTHVMHTLHIRSHTLYIRYSYATMTDRSQ